MFLMTGGIGVEEEDHRSKMPFPSHRIRGLYYRDLPLSTLALASWPAEAPAVRFLHLPGRRSLRAAHTSEVGRHAPPPRGGQSGHFPACPPLASNTLPCCAQQRVKLCLSLRVSQVRRELDGKGSHMFPSKGGGLACNAR